MGRIVIKKKSESIDDIWLLTAHHFPFSFCLTYGQADKKGQIIPPLVQAGNSNHTSPGLCARTLTQAPTPNHNKSWASLLSMLFQAMFGPACESTLVSPENLITWVINFIILMGVWCHWSWYPKQNLGGRSIPPLQDDHNRCGKRERSKVREKYKNTG